MIRNILLISTLGVLLASIYMPLTYYLRRLTSSSVVQQHNSKTKHQRCIRMPDAGPPLILAYDLHQVWSSAIQNTDHHYPGKPKWAYVLVPSDQSLIKWHGSLRPQKNIFTLQTLAVSVKVALFLAKRQRTGWTCTWIILCWYWIAKK